MGSDVDPPSGNPRPRRRRVSFRTVAQSFRAQLTQGEDVIDPGDVGRLDPAGHRHRPARARRRSRWFNLLWLLPIGFVLLLVAVAVAKGLRDEPSVQQFIARHPGTDAARIATGDDRAFRRGRGGSTSSTCSS